MTVARVLHRVIFAAFIISAVVWLVSVAAFPALAESGWVEGVFLALALMITLQSSARSLPMQNVGMVVLILTLISGMVLLVSARTNIPFGPRTFSPGLDPQLFDLLPWSLPAVWVVAILNSRGVARLILRPWRKVGRYGYWSICLTVALTLIFDFNLEPFASLVSQWWIWRTPGASMTWHTAPWVNFLGWGITTIIALAFATPWLIDKSPRRQSSPDYRVLATWLVLNLLPAAGCAMHQLWSAAAVGVVTCGAVTFYAIRGARW